MGNNFKCSCGIISLGIASLFDFQIHWVRHEAHPHNNQRPSFLFLNSNQFNYSFNSMETNLRHQRELVSMFLSISHQGLIISLPPHVMTFHIRNKTSYNKCTCQFKCTCAVNVDLMASSRYVQCKCMTCISPPSWIWPQFNQ